MAYSKNEKKLLQYAKLMGIEVKLPIKKFNSKIKNEKPK